MKFLVGSILKTFLYLLILIVPITLFITFFALGKTGLPLWNIGIRNILTYARDFFVPSVILSYLIASLLVVAMVDKMKVKSLFVLHLPSFILACIIGAGIFFTRSDVPFTLPKGSLRVGPGLFFKEGVFIQAGSRKIQLVQTKQRNPSMYYYDINRNRLSVIQNVSMGKDGANRVYTDDKERRVVIVSKRALSEGTVRIPYEDFTRSRNTTDLQIFRVYGTQIRGVQRAILKRMESLGQRDQYIFLGSLLLTLLMVTIPVVYGMNDRGWGFSGIIGIFLVLAVLPFFYNFVFRMTGRFGTRVSAIGRYYYLMPALVIGLCGIVIDLIVAARSRVKG